MLDSIVTPAYSPLPELKAFSWSLSEGRGPVPSGRPFPCRGVPHHGLGGEHGRPQELDFEFGPRPIPPLERLILELDNELIRGEGGPHCRLLQALPLLGEDADLPSLGYALLDGLDEIPAEVSGKPAPFSSFAADHGNVLAFFENPQHPEVPFHYSVCGNYIDVHVNLHPGQDPVPAGTVFEVRYAAELYGDGSTSADEVRAIGERSLEAGTLVVEEARR